MNFKKYFLLVLLGTVLCSFSFSEAAGNSDLTASDSKTAVLFSLTNRAGFLNAYFSEPKSIDIGFFPGYPFICAELEQKLNSRWNILYGADILPAVIINLLSVHISPVLTFEPFKNHSSHYLEFCPTLYTGIYIDPFGVAGLNAELKTEFRVLPLENGFFFGAGPSVVFDFDYFYRLSLLNNVIAGFVLTLGWKM